MFLCKWKLEGQIHIKNMLFADLRRDFHPLFSKLLWLAMKSWKAVWFHNCGISPLRKTLMIDQTVFSKLLNAQMMSWVLLREAHLIRKFIQHRKDYTRVGVAFWNLSFWSFLWNLQTAQLIEEFLAPKYFIAFISFKRNLLLTGGVILQLSWGYAKKKSMNMARTRPFLFERQNKEIRASWW